MQLLSVLAFPCVATLAMVATPLKTGVSPASSVAKSADWPTFRDKAMAKVTSHPIVVGNKYTEWFAEGQASVADQKELVVQFSVFSQLFLIAQLNKIINAPSLDEMREGKEILANEIGVIFNNGKKKDKNDDTVAEVSGTIEGGIFKHKAAHFEWLLDARSPARHARARRRVFDGASWS